jgi:hypothetical protein
LAEYFADQLVEELVFADVVQTAIDSRGDWPGSLKTAVRAAAAGRTATPAEVGPKVWRFVRGGGDQTENTRAVRIAEALYRRLPTDPLARRCLALALYRTEQAEKALAVVADAAGPDDEALRALACLQLHRVSEASQALTRLRKVTHGTTWAEDPLARILADAIRTATPSPVQEGALADWDSLLVGAIALLGEDLDHYYTMAELRYAHGTVLGQQGQLLLDRKDFAAAASVLMKSLDVSKQARAAHDQVNVPRFDQAVVEAINRLVRLYEATGQMNEVAKWRKELAAVTKPMDKSKTP